MSINANLYKESAKTGDVKMNDKKCMKCKEPLQGTLPICQDCRMRFKDSTDPVTKQEISGFTKLAEFLNGFEGDKNDLIYLIKSEIADRQSWVISCCKVVTDLENGTISLEPPDGNRFAKQKVDEINKLYNALAIIKRHYGG